MSTITKPPGHTPTKPSGGMLFSVEQFARMQDAGVFEGKHVELLDGEPFEVVKNPPHNAAVDALADALGPLLPRGCTGSARRNRSSPGCNWWPEPDIAVVRGNAADYFDRHPGPADTVLVAEICENSPQDRTKKLDGYAEAGFPVYWILDLQLRRLEVYSGPAGASTRPR